MTLFNAIIAEYGFEYNTDEEYYHKDGFIIYPETKEYDVVGEDGKVVVYGDYEPLSELLQAIEVHFE